MMIRLASTMRCVAEPASVLARIAVAIIAMDAGSGGLSQAANAGRAVPG